MDGFSFCVFDKEGQLVNATCYDFLERCATPEELLSHVKEIFEKDATLHANFSHIRVTHRNNLFSVVPNEFFIEQGLKRYLNFSVKTFASDYVTHDDIDAIAAKNVFIPFVNVNNYLLDHFGDFDFYHHQSLLIDKAFQLFEQQDKARCLAHLHQGILDIVVMEKGQLLLANSFEVDSSEDFAYYLLFVYNQLGLDTSEVPLTLIGALSNTSDEFDLAYRYIKEVELWSDSPEIIANTPELHGADFYLLN